MESDWRHKAACAKTDPELFFPTGETSKHDLDQIQGAKAFCVRCLVKERCLEYALETHQAFGVWGGMSTAERKAFVRRARHGY
ncbi:MAG: WhiB family transcriptional regulator [Candidatus Microsaccharimonas sossegonensis]|uniref:WhiB family transcriptional regulator n=1 Tax=Candidatus Microsaccharimonas sossegonensis TaxID=2506948 RepID=A0A4Q0AGY2_9BACT|nr:MAG: WhiB family transcriptional regulator [Candidatus Microsaccharimonas sossegonensis]